VQSVPITTKVKGLNLAHDEVYSIKHYVIKFVSDLRQVSGFYRVLRFPPPIKLTVTTEILLKVALDTIKLTVTTEILLKVALNTIKLTVTTEILLKVALDTIKLTVTTEILLKCHFQQYFSCNGQFYCV
jgi:phosphotransferase system IIA component